MSDLGSKDQKLEPIEICLGRWLKHYTAEYDAEIASHMIETEIADFAVRKLAQPIVDGSCVVLVYDSGEADD